MGRCFVLNRTALLLALLLSACALPKQPIPGGAHARVYVLRLTPVGLVKSAGTGVFVARSAFGSVLLTARHVIEGAVLLVVASSRGQARSRVVAVHPTEDLAAVLVPHEAEERAAVAETSPAIGDRLRVLGSQLSGDPTLADGIVSSPAVPCRLSPGTRHCRMSTVPVGPGHSGAGVFDEVGRLVGIVMAYQAVRPHFAIHVGLRAVRELLALVPAAPVQ